MGRRVTRRLTRLQTMFNVLNIAKHGEITTTFHFTGTATEPQWNQIFRQFNMTSTVRRITWHLNWIQVITDQSFHFEIDFLAFEGTSLSRCTHLHDLTVVDLQCCVAPVKRRTELRYRCCYTFWSFEITNSDI